MFGFQPSRGAISCRGILRQSERLDQAGSFVRKVEDLALLGEVLATFDPDDEAMQPLEVQFERLLCKS